MGTKEFKRTLIETHREQLELREYGQEKALQEAKELGWEHTLAKCRDAATAVSTDVRSSKKSAAWKIAVAARLKDITTARNQWLGSQLKMGPAESVSRYVSELKQGKRPDALRIYRQIAKVVV